MIPRSLIDAQADFLSPLALKKAGQVVSEIMDYYAPLHDMTTHEWTELAPILLALEAFIYQIDDLVETQVVDMQELGERALGVWQDYLSMHGLADERIQLETSMSLAYWHMEAAMLRGAHLDEHDLRSILYWKSYDYRLLHLVMFRFIGQAYDELLLELCRTTQNGLEIDDDIDDYAKDIASGDLNLLALAVRCYGEEGPAHLQNTRDQLNASKKKLEAELARLKPDKHAIWTCVASQLAADWPSPAMPNPVLDATTPHRAPNTQETHLAVSMASLHARWDQLLRRAQMVEPDLRAASKMAICQAHEWLFSTTP